MGIKRFFGFFPKDICCEEESITNYDGKIIAIDAMHYIYTKCIGIRNSGNDLLNNRGESVSHLISLLKLSCWLFENNITPIYVFDSKNPNIKQNTINERRKVKQKAINKCSLMTNKNTDDFIKFFKRSYFLNNVQVESCKKLLNYMGIPHINGVKEADSQCAGLTHNLASCVISNDTDLLLFGATKIILGIDKIRKKVKVLKLDDIIDYLTYKANIIRDKLMMDRIVASHDVFIDFAIMMGTDYTKSITGITPEELFNIFAVKSFDVVSTINNLYLMKSRTKKIFVGDNFITNWQSAKKYYSCARIVHPMHVNKTIIHPQVKQLIKFLCDDNGINYNYIDKNINMFVNKNLNLKI